MKYDKMKAKKVVDTIKVLSALAVEKAGSGHPGAPLGLADLCFILWQYFLKFNPKDTSFLGRDIFILSNGHASILQYVLLHLYGFDISIDDIKNFRQLNSKTPGHPEYGLCPGVETSTGPLGQGFANGVGFAMARKILAKKDLIFDNKIYCIIGDGDIMEGISSEAASLAGHLELDNLIYIYDSNSISIEGSTNLALSENVKAKFEAMNWNVLSIDGHEHSEIIGALNTANISKGKPNLIIAKTVIAKSSGSKEGSESSHGAPLGKVSIDELKKNLNWNEEDFIVPQEVYEYCFEKVIFMKDYYDNWQNKFKLIDDDELLRSFNFKVDEDLIKSIRELAKNENEASRKSSSKFLQIISQKLPNFIGGSADLGPSNLTLIKNEKSFSAQNYEGRNLHFGVREHAMGAIANGIFLNGPFIPYVSTFLVFSDYMRASIRLSALMKLKVIYIFTHDSIFVGEDGPTHQPIEQLSLLRLIPDLSVIRPMNDQETAESYIYALQKKNGPTAIILSRQNINLKISLTQNDVAIGLKKGAYIVKKEVKKLQLVILASGTEVETGFLVAEKLNILDSVRIISVPILENLDKEKLNLIPEKVKIIILEAGTTRLWNFCGPNVLKIGVEGFGTSAKPQDVAKFKGFDIESISKKVKEFIS